MFLSRFSGFRLFRIRVVAKAQRQRLLLLLLAIIGVMFPKAISLTN